MFDISKHYPIFKNIAFYLENDNKQTLLGLGLLNKTFMYYFIPVLWRKYAYDYFSNTRSIYYQGNLLIQILYNNLPIEYQQLLLNKDLSYKTYDSYCFDEIYSIVFIKTNYTFNYSSFLSELPCKLITNYINHGKEKDYVIGLFISYYFNLIKR